MALTDRRRARAGHPGAPPPPMKPADPARPLASAPPRWSQSERWFWLTFPATQERELVKPAGVTHRQGPFEMVQYTTQGGSLKACTVGFFESNAVPYQAGRHR